MHTVRIQVSDRTHSKLFNLLKQLDKKDVQVIEEDTNFQEAQQLVKEDYVDYKSGKTETISLIQFEKELLSR